MNKDIIGKLVNLVRKETIPAIGCTEPVAVAYAASAASKFLGEEMESLNIRVSKNIYKNGKFAGIPNTGESGLDLAGALGGLTGDFNAGLMILQSVNKEDIDTAHKFIEGNKVSIEFLDESPDVYVEVFAKGKNNKVEVVLINNHDYVDEVKLNDKVVYKGRSDRTTTSVSFLDKLTIKDLREITEIIPIEELGFIEEGIKLNMDAAEKGLGEGIGLGLGLGFKNLEKQGKITMDGPTRARILTAAAADMRMGGAVCPIMTSGGSGNQGIGVILPITVIGEEHNLDRVRILRAVFFGHAVNKYVKVFTGKLSYMCGCAIGAGVGASAGIAWLLGGNDEEISGACNNLFGNLTGMVCDGAKESCSLKLSTSAAEAVLSAYLAKENVILKAKVGIVGSTVEDTIRNVGILCKADDDIDSTILKIMS